MRTHTLLNPQRKFPDHPHRKPVKLIKIDDHHKERYSHLECFNIDEKTKQREIIKNKPLESLNGCVE